jgi:hypothetical protein
MAPKRKKMLHILKTEPDDLQRTLMYNLSLGYSCLQFPLFEMEDIAPDYEELVDLIFDFDEVVSWW